MGRASRRRAAARAQQARPASAGHAAGSEAATAWVAAHSYVTLQNLRDAAQRRAALEAEIDGIVRGLVARGIGWGDIGRALGITRQGARQRYNRP